eukprot:PhF_6_TR36531/c0_g1_i2/m.53844/K04990/PKD2L1; polycystin 2L1
MSNAVEPLNESNLNSSSNNNNNQQPTLLLLDPSPQRKKSLSFGGTTSVALSTDVPPAGGVAENSEDTIPASAKRRASESLRGRRLSVQSDNDDNHSQSHTPRGSVSGRRKSHSAVKQQVVSLEFAIQETERQVVAQSMYFELGVFIPFVILFVFFFLQERNMEANYYTIRSVRYHVQYPKFATTPNNVATFQGQIATESMINLAPDHTYADVGNAGDWLQWLMEGFVENTYFCKTDPDTAYQILTPMGQNIHIGAARIRTIRVRNDSCSFLSDISPSDPNSPFRQNFGCYAPHSKEAEVTSQFCNIDYSDQTHTFGETTTAREGVYHPGGFIKMLPFNISCNDARAVVQTLMDCNFVDNKATRFATLEFFIYTPQTDTYQSIKYFTEVLPGGAWVAQYKLRSFQARTLRYESQMILDFFFLAYVLYYCITYFYAMIRSIITKQWREFFFDPWNFLEIGNLTTFGFVYVMRFQWWYLSDQANLKLPGPPTYPEALEDILIAYSAQVYANSINVLLTFIKLFKYVRVIESLSVLTKTIALAGSDIIGILILFGFVIVGYSLCALTLYGSNMEDFRSFGMCVSTLLRMLVGNFDYPSMHEINRYLTGFFFWTYVIIALFLLLNFLIAVLSDAFAEVSGKARSEPLAVIIRRIQQEWQQLFTKEHVISMVKLFGSGNTITGMMRVMLVDLHKKRAEHEEKGELPDQVFLTRQDLELVVTPRALQGLGPRYVDTFWISLVNDYEDMLRSSIETERKEVIDIVKLGVDQSLEMELNKIERFDLALSDLEFAMKDLLRMHRARKKSRSGSVVEHVAEK